MYFLDLVSTLAPVWGHKFMIGETSRNYSCVCCVLQGVHECKAVTNDYLKLESLVQKVVSPYLGTHGLFSSDGSVAQCSCVLGEFSTSSSITEQCYD